MFRHAITNFKTPLSAAAFQQTYPALLKMSGYRTGFLGKYAIGNPSGDQKELSLPAKQFDFWYGFPQSIDFRQEVDGKLAAGRFPPMMVRSNLSQKMGQKAEVVSSPERKSE